MALGIFINGLVDEDTVVAIYQSILKSSFTDTGGTTTVSYSVDGVSETFQYSMSPKDILLECKLFLQTYYPNTYGKRITQTRPFYSC
jgi:hypothetical protein